MVKDININAIFKSDDHKTIARILVSGKAFTKIELSVMANVSREIVENVLHDFKNSGLLYTIDNRRPYNRFVNEEVIDEAVSQLEPLPGEGDVVKTNPLHHCRSCYGHLAGKVGVKVTQALIDNNYIHKIGNGESENFEVTPMGKVFFEKFGIDVEALEKSGGRFIKACLDFSERQYHLGGRLGVALLNAMKLNGWIVRERNSRVHVLTAKGRDELNRELDLQLKIVP